MFRDVNKQAKDNRFAETALGSFLKGTLVALGFTILVFAVFALLLTYTGLSEAVIPFVVILTAVLSVVLAGMSAAKTAANRGYLKGAAMGIFYVLLLYVLALLLSGKFFFGTNILILLAIGLFGGAAGGILGINLSVKQRRSYRETH